VTDEDGGGEWKGCWIDRAGAGGFDRDDDATFGDFGVGFGLEVDFSISVEAISCDRLNSSKSNMIDDWAGATVSLFLTLDFGRGGRERIDEDEGRGAKGRARNAGRERGAGAGEAIDDEGDPTRVLFGWTWFERRGRATAAGFEFEAGGGGDEEVGREEEKGEVEI